MQEVYALEFGFDEIGVGKVFLDVYKTEKPNPEGLSF